MTHRDQIRQWLLALRDLCGQGATAASVTLPGKGDGPPPILSYSRDGALLLAGGRTLRFGDEWLDWHGLALSPLGVAATIESATEPSRERSESLSDE